MAKLSSVALLSFVTSVLAAATTANSDNHDNEIEDIAEWKSEFFMYVMETTPTICSEAEASSANVTAKLIQVRKLMELSPEEILAKYGSLQSVKTASAPLFSELNGGISVMCSLRDEQVCMDDKCVSCMLQTNKTNLKVICDEATKLNGIYNEGLVEMAKESKKTAKRIMGMKLKGRGDICRDNSLRDQVEFSTQVNFFLRKSEEEIVKERVDISGYFQTSTDWNNRLLEMEQEAVEMCSIANEQLICLEGLCKACEDTSEEMQDILKDLGYCENADVGKVTSSSSGSSDSLIVFVSGFWTVLVNLLMSY